MEMNYWYDWTFQGTPAGHDGGDAANKIEFVIVNSLRCQSPEERLDFTAKLRMISKQLHPFMWRGK